MKKRTFEDPPLLNRSASNELLSCKAIAEMFRADAEKIHENWKAFEARRRVAELRKSCGVKPEKTSTINIRLPPRYQALPPVPKCKHDGCPNFVESSEEYCTDHL